ncbi:EAL domain-containing protein [Aliikangiella sp. IMCC44653]
MKNLSKQFPLRVQLTIMASSILLLFTLIAVGLISYFNQQLESQVIENKAFRAQIFANDLVPVLQSTNYESATERLKVFSEQNHVRKAAVYLSDGSALAYYNLLPQSKQPDLSGPRLQLEQAKIKIIEPIYTNYSETDILGYFYSENHLPQLRSIQKTRYIYLASIFLAALVVTYIVAGFFEQSLTYPIRRMVRHIKRIYKNQSFETRLKSRRNDEVGGLIKEFNLMLDTVQERENDLTLQGKQLQRLVEVRTEQLYQKAHFDSLTGLPNRYLLVDRLHHAITNSSRNSNILALLFLDLDRFKVINDNLGHQSGDLLLKEVAKRLSKLAREGDTVARLGGDEFVFLLENLNNPQDAAKTARRIISSFKTPFHIQEHILHVSTSIGISIFPENGEDDKTLLKNADISMYHAKEKGPGHFSYYNEEMNRSSLERLAIETNLRSAIDKHELYLLYQPQRRTSDNEYKNVEALIRWKNPEIGFVSPGEFIPIAEETGLINQIDRWVISEACKQLNNWKQQGFTDVTVAVNISAGHLISDTLLEHIKAQLIIHQVNPNQLEIEITEAVFVEHSERTLETLRAMKKMGLRIAIDDFGTGYSSLQYIQNFPADTLKLDGMFITNLMESKESQGIVRSTIILAHSLGLELVAEGVETEEQLKFLTEHQCDLIQGFLFSKAIKPQEVPNFVKQAHTHTQ